MKPNLSDFLTRVEAADYLDTSRSTIDRRMRDGALPKYRLPGTNTVYLLREDLDRLRAPAPEPAT